VRRELEFPERPTGTVFDLWRATLDLVQQLRQGAKAFVIKDVSVGTTSTALRHGLRGPPSMWKATPHADARVFRGAISDATFIYLQANTAVTCDVEITP
jgi:hypothetical protein